MTERERLIELLDDMQHQDNSANPNKNYIQNSELADYLLKSGMIVPPVKVGDTVYAISRGAIIPITIDRIQYSNRGIDILGRDVLHFGYGTVAHHPDDKIGLEWYKTKEEAEEKLKEMK